MSADILSALMIAGILPAHLSPPRWRRWLMRARCPRSLQENKLKKISLFIFLFLITGILSAQEDPTQAFQDAVRIYNDAAQQLQRANLRSQKKQIINNSLSLTTEQAKAFWPVYDKYEVEFTKINDARLAI